jgi:hypothetical protein
VRSEAIRLAEKALDHACVSLPVPAYTVRVRRQDTQAAGQPPPALSPEQRPKAVADVSRQNVVEQQATASRAEGGPNLLDPAAPREL